MTSFGDVACLPRTVVLLQCALLFDRRVVYSADLTSITAEVDVKLLYGTNCLRAFQANMYVFKVSTVFRTYPVLALNPFGVVVFSFRCQKTSRFLSRSIFSELDLVSSSRSFSCSIGCSSMCSSKLQSFDSAKC